MKNICNLIFLFVLFNLNTSAQTTRILFIGNSYTAVNNLPATIYSVALSNGDTIIVDSYTPGGYTFEGHSTDPNTIAKIYSQQWDYVILQEQSQRPSFPPFQVQSDVYPFAAILDSLIHDNNPCTETVFYMTWGRKNGDASNCAGWPPVCTYEGMQARLRESYLEMGMLNNATVGPVGAAWRYMRSLNPAFDLYQPDESHPSVHGTYLAACVLYSTIFHKSPFGISFTSTLPPVDATEIQNAVNAVVTDSIATWYEYGNIPFSSFSYTANGNNFLFQNHSLNASGYTWDFGDGSSSTMINPSHTFSQSGTYSVVLTATNGCRADELTMQVTTGVSGLQDPDNGCVIYNNPNTGRLIFNCLIEVDHAHVHDLSGKRMQTEIIRKSDGMEISANGLKPGIYVVTYSGDGNFFSYKWIVGGN